MNGMLREKSTGVSLGSPSRCKLSATVVPVSGETYTWSRKPFPALTSCVPKGLFEVAAGSDVLPGFSVEGLVGLNDESRCCEFMRIESLSGIMLPCESALDQAPCLEELPRYMFSANWFGLEYWGKEETIVNMKMYPQRKGHIFDLTVQLVRKISRLTQFYELGWKEPCWVRQRKLVCIFPSDVSMKVYLWIGSLFSWGSLGGSLVKLQYGSLKVASGDGYNPYGQHKAAAFTIYLAAVPTVTRKPYHLNRPSTSPLKSEGRDRSEIDRQRTSRRRCQNVKWREMITRPWLLQRSRV